MTETTFDTKCNILGEVWAEHFSDPKFAKVIEYNNVGLPLAFAVDVQLVESTPRAEAFIEESFLYLLEAFGVAEDTGFDNLDDIVFFALDNQE